MDTIIGFIAGYLAGAQDGRAGLERARKSADAIRSSPELRRLVGEGIMMAQAAVGRVSKGDLGETIGGVTELIAARAGARGDRRAA
ncbi:MAG TPA: hypothetical protein VG253_00660 [Streptosporangiaceae bacterium]|nr:hypothetical protein [Streptosporangiaceae bacterium]